MCAVRRQAEACKASLAVLHRLEAMAPDDLGRGGHPKGMCAYKEALESMRAEAAERVEAEGVEAV